MGLPIAAAPNAAWLNKGFFENAKAGSHGRGLMFGGARPQPRADPSPSQSHQFNLIGRNVPIRVTGSFRCE